MSNKYWLGAAAAAVLLSVCAPAGATRWYKWCTTWNSQYTDASGDSSHEDHYTSTSATSRTAEYSYYTVYAYDPETEDETFVSSGYLTEYSIAFGKYCTPYIPVSTQTTYRFRQYTKLNRSSRYIYIEPDGKEDWGNYSLSVRTTTYINWPEDNTETVVSIDPSYLTRQTSIAPIAARLMHYANTYGYPNDSGKNLYIISDPGMGDGPTGEEWTCGDGTAGAYASNYDASWAAKYRVCAADFSSAIPKFETTHEIGHMISAMSSGPFHNGSYGADTGVFAPSTDLCGCDHIGSTEAHCIQSREFIGRASSEGYAHFLSSRVFNNQETNGSFNYYKAVLTSVSPYTVDPEPVWLDISDNETWMENKCDPDDDDTFNVGTEWDWLQFFWHLHAHGGSNNWAVSEITNVWQDTPETRMCCHMTATPPQCFAKNPIYQCSYSYGIMFEEIWMGELWDDLWDETGDDGFTTTKRNRFYYEGGYAGVDY